MYSIVMMAAMTGAPETPDCSRHGYHGYTHYSYSCYGGWHYGYHYGGRRCCNSCYTYWRGYPCYTYAPTGWIIVGDATPRAAEASATVIVSLPEDAKLSVDSNPTTSQGPVREFATPALPTGVDFSYTFTATVVRGGKEMKVERKVGVRAGEVTRLSLDIPREVASR
jgi:uncharacterized protein (TIGR03000 family)